MSTVRTERKAVMFMSADIAGSTEFKNQSERTDGRTAWLRPFEKFFREFPLILMGELAFVLEELATVPDVGVWRVGGDEIVFCAEPTSENEAAAIVAGFCRALTKFESGMANEWGLRLYGCCWAGIFPDENIEIEILEMATVGRRHGGKYIEYLGPDVDIGFRIAKVAGAGGVAISLNLASAISGNSGIRLTLLGKKSLKGMFGGHPYPLIEVEANMEGGLGKFVSETKAQRSVTSKINTEHLSRSDIRDIENKFLSAVSHIEKNHRLSRLFNAI